MQELPVLPDACTLDAEGVAAQGARYAAAGAGAELIESADRSFAIRVAPDVEPHLIGELIATENDCCPFFQITWSPESRRLSFGVERPEDAPALDAIAYALGMEEPRRPVQAG